MNINSKKILVILVLLVVIFAIVGAFFSQQNKQSTQKQITQTPNQSIIATSGYTPTTEPNISSSLKTYTNTKYGFSFQYPQAWSVFEENSIGRYSKFDVFVTSGIADPEAPFLVNIVLPEFADRTFLGVGAATSTVTVDGISGVKYVYMFENNPETAIVVPFGQYKMILGTRAPYEKDYYQILSTFKFLK